MNVPLTPIRFLQYARRQFPDRTAIVCGEDRFTYTQFAERVDRLSGALRGAGIKPGDRAAFLSTNCHRLLEAYYGVLQAGAVLLPLNIRLSVAELTYILNDSGAKLLFFEEQFLGTVNALRGALSTVGAYYLLDGRPQADWLAAQNYEEFVAASEPFRTDIAGYDENALAEIFYTSGTSANPKGVMLTHRNVYLHALNVLLALDIGLSAVQLHTIPLFHANGWGAAHTLTFRGGKHVMIHRFDPAEVCRLIERERVQSCLLVPIMASALVNFPERGKYDLRSLEWITIGGAASPPALVREVEEKLGCTCYSGYGLTETAPVLTIAHRKPGIPWEGEQRHVNQAMTGYAIPGVEIRVVDAEDRDVPHDGKSVGEIITRADCVMEGYWRQPEASAEALRGGWFHTGDMATIDENEYVLIVDRRKDIIISGGENIPSVEVEKALMAHPAVLDAAVIPVPDERWGEVPKGLVVLKPGARVTEAELIEFCRARISHYKAPRSVEFLESLPKNATGKTLKKELRKRYWGGREDLKTSAPA